MFNTHLYKKTIKATWKLWFLLLLPAIIIIPLAFTIDLKDAKEPQFQSLNFLELILLGTKHNLSTIGPVLMVGPSIYVMSVANALFAKDVESQSITFIMVTPLSKTKIFWTKVIHLYLSLWIGYVVNLIVLLPCIWASKNYDGFPMGMFVGKFTVMWLWFSAVAAIALLASAFFNKTVWSITTSGILIAWSIVINIVAMVVTQFAKDTEWIKWLSFSSIYTETSFYDMDKPQKYLPHILTLSGIFVGCTIGAWQVFIRKDLPL